MLQNVAAHNIRVPKRKVFKTYTSHNVQHQKMYIITKHKVHIKGIVQPFELGGVTRLIRYAVKFCMAGN